MTKNKSVAIFVTDSTVFIILGGNPNVEELVLSSLNDFGNLSPGEEQLLSRKITKFPRNSDERIVCKQSRGELKYIYPIQSRKQNHVGPLC